MSDDNQDKEVGWVTSDGQEVKPDENGVWPPVQTDSEGHTIVGGPGKTDQV